MRRTFILPLVAAALCLSSGSAAQAADCASTLGPESSFGGGTYGITGTGAGPGTQWAFAFTPSVDCQLGTVEVAFHLGSGTNGLRISVFEDNGGLPTGTLVESTTVLGAMTSDPGGSLVMGVFSGATLLGGGSTYWVAVGAEPATGDTFAVWHANDLALTGARATRTSTTGWQGSVGSLAAFRVSEGGVGVPMLSFRGRALLVAALLLWAGRSLVAGRNGRRPLGTAS